MNHKTFIASGFAGLAIIAAAVGMTASADAAPVEPRVAAAAPAIPQGSITHFHIADQTEADLMKTPDKSVWSNSLNNSVVSEQKLHPAVRTKLTYGAGSVVSISDSVPIVYVGGPFNDPARGKTTVGKFDLAPGTWLLTTSAKFTRTEAAAAGEAATRPMVGLRYNVSDTNVWGEDAGSIGGADISPVLNRDLFGSAVQTVKVTTPVTVFVYGFGYADDQGSAASGKINVQTSTTATKIGS
jgi:hypothetical protein